MFYNGSNWTSEIEYLPSVEIQNEFTLILLYIKLIIQSNKHCKYYLHLLLKIIKISIQGQQRYSVSIIVTNDSQTEHCVHNEKFK